MNCYVCEARGVAAPAVAVCQHCGVAMCLEHFDEDLLVPRAQGLVRRGCTHEPIHDAQVRRRARQGGGARR